MPIISLDLLLKLGGSQTHPFGVSHVLAKLCLCHPHLSRDLRQVCNCLMIK